MMRPYTFEIGAVCHDSANPLPLVPGGGTQTDPVRHVVAV
ncbi:MAG: hypothetical protein ACI91G_000515, partial [Gammaproteobacteria bacterium]